jgi:hypothetical protein
LLTGPLTGIYVPHGMGSTLFAVLAVAAQLDRDYIREKPRRPAGRRRTRQPRRWELPKLFYLAPSDHAIWHL